LIALRALVRIFARCAGVVAVALTTIALVTPLAHANPPAILAPAMASCGAWVAARDHKGSYKTQLEAWVSGMMSGLASAKCVAPGTELLHDVDAATVFNWMDNYCRSHPRQNLSDGASVLEGELLEKAKARATSASPKT
jgi:hypothetical protein